MAVNVRGFLGSQESKLNIIIAFMVHAFYIFLGPRCQEPSLHF